MGRCCCVAGCENSRRPSAVIHTFPRQATMRKCWLDQIEHFCGKLKVNAENFGICSLHFKSTDYENTNAGPSKKRLLKLAIPSVFGAVDVPNMNGTQSNSRTVIREEDSSTGVQTVTISKDDYMALLRNLRNSKKNASKKSVQSKAKVGTLQNQISQLTIELDSQKSELEELRSLKSAVSKLFSRQQLQLLTGNSTRVCWSELDIAKSIALQATSSKAYTYLRKNLHLPLPAPCTLYQWLSKIEIKPGILTSVFGLIQQQISEAAPLTKVGVLAFDEMSIDESYCYDSQLDQVFGKEDCANGTFLRGLFYPWKHMVQYGFEKMTKPLLLEVLKYANESGVSIAAIVSDMGPKNQAVWRDLGVCGVEKGELGPTHFQHPATGQNVWVFPDYPHLLKLLRNHVIDNGLTLPDGSHMDKDIFITLLGIQRQEYKLAHKLTYKHVYVRDKERQKVLPAFQLFSNTVGQAIKLLLPQFTSQAEFVLMINNLSDLMNTRTKGVSNNIFKSPFGTYLNLQMEFLNHFCIYFKNVVVGNRRKGTFAPFQKGILIAIKSLIGLYLDVSDSPSRCQYIMTSHLNQDYVESSFSTIRGIGRFSLSPTAVDFKSRVRKVIIGWNFCSGRNTCITDTEVAEQIPAVHLKALMSTKSEKSRPSTSCSMETDDVEMAWADIDPAVDVREKNYSLPTTATEICEEGGREFVCGFLARKLQEQFPILTTDSSSANGFWLKKISEGGLTTPSNWWLAYMEKFDQYFCALHPYQTIDKDPKVVERLSRKLRLEFPEVSAQIIDYYSKIRTLIRVKTMNKQLESDKFKRKEAKLTSRKEERRMLMEYQIQEQEREMVVERDKREREIAEEFQDIDDEELLDTNAAEQLDELLTLLNLNKKSST